MMSPLKYRCINLYYRHISALTRSFHTSQFLSAKQTEAWLEDEEFRVLVIPGHTKVPEKKREAKRTRKEVVPPRYKSMPVDQDWTDVWPAAHTFKWSAVPFPVRQGFVERSENEGIPPAKYANAELMKIPNFLHLTPSHVKKQCEVLKQFCSKWPEGLETDDICEKHFPVEIITRDYVRDGASIRDHRSRVVTIKVKLSTLNLDNHAKDKFVRLARDRLDQKTDMISLNMDKCPLKRQNYDHGMYQLTALYYESHKTEPWESEKTLEDMEKYYWDMNISKSKLLHLLKTKKQVAGKSQDGVSRLPVCLRSVPDDVTDEKLVKLPDVVEYQEAVSELLNEGENLTALNRYKSAVKRLVLSSSVSS